MERNCPEMAVSRVNDQNGTDGMNNRQEYRDFFRKTTIFCQIDLFYAVIFALRMKLTMEFYLHMGHGSQKLATRNLATIENLKRASEDFTVFFMVSVSKKYFLKQK